MNISGSFLPPGSPLTSPKAAPGFLRSCSIFGKILGLDVLPKANLIGLEYYNNVNDNANANMAATAYGDFGIFGLFLISIISAYFVRFISINSSHIHIEIRYILSLFIGIVLSQGALHTAMLSNGLLWVLIIVAFLPIDVRFRKLRQR